MHFKRWWCWHLHWAYMVPMKGQLVTSPTLIQEFNQSHSDVFKIDCDRVHSRWRPDGDELQRQRRKKQAWAVDTYIDFNNYCCKDTNTKYKKEEGGVGSWCQEAQHNNIALIQVRNTDTRWETLIQGEAHWYKDELWYKEVRSFKKVHWYIVHQWYKDTKI